MKILNFDVTAVKTEGVSTKVVEGKEVTRNWAKYDLKVGDTIILTLWKDRETTDFQAGGIMTKYAVYKASKVDPKNKESKLRRKWWIRVDANDPALVTTTSKAGNTYKEVIPTEVPKGWDVKAFYYEKLGKVGVSVSIKETI